MCGIVGYIGSEQAAPILLDGLKRLEYRGYDSAGVAVRAPKSGISIRRAVGKLRNLEQVLLADPPLGSVGIGHTRWATHGRPSETNAHPHVAGSVAVVHNGIIENHVALRNELQASGHKINSETDTEIVAHLIDQEQKAGRSLVDSVRSALKKVSGSYALAVISESEPDRIVVAKKNSPIVLGLGEGANFCASDIPALLPFTDHMVFLEEGDIAVIKSDQYSITDASGKEVNRRGIRVSWSPAMAEKEGYKHFMLKEIFEQPRALENTLDGRIDWNAANIIESEIGLTPKQIAEVQRVYLLACGTSHHATIAARYWIESMVRLPATVELASEFRQRNPVIGPKDLVVAVSQSGETVDTLVAAEEAKRAGATVLAIANVARGALSRLAHASFYTHAGPEIGVASTKCFTAQLVNLFMLSLWLGRSLGRIDNEQANILLAELMRLPQLVTDTLSKNEKTILSVAQAVVPARDVLYIGRGLSYPIALEGALKLKEVSYIHAEGYAAGEMKHGPIALLDTDVPTVAVAPQDSHYARMRSNVEEAKARGSSLICVLSEGNQDLREIADHVLEIPRCHELLTPFLSVIPLQLLAYHVADLKGTDVDQPRNLAKTVTVE